MVLNIIAYAAQISIMYQMEDIAATINFIPLLAMNCRIAAPVEMYALQEIRAYKEYAASRAAIRLQDLESSVMGQI